MQLAHPRQPITDPPGGQDDPVLVEQAQVMVGLAPVDPKKPHIVLLCFDIFVSQRRTCGALMAVPTWRDIPPAVRPPRPPAGARAPRELQGPQASEYSPTGSSAVASHRRLVPPMRTACGTSTSRCTCTTW
jgi:hypothetical protein